MVYKKTKNCWEFWKCSKNIHEKCPAYETDSGRECWMVAGTFRKEGCPKLKKKYKSCLDCTWFKKLNPDFFAKP
ncbi:Uncharacterised protein [uncultured archaeon]|nr:Uncharacterised protein [uncultured archaeon]